MHRRPTKCTKCGLMTNGSDDVLELGYTLDISHFLFTQQELSSYELYSIFSSPLSRLRKQ